jgi:hypothetical protein
MTTVPALIGCLATIGGEPFLFRIALYANVVGLATALLLAIPGLTERASPPASESPPRTAIRWVAALNLAAATVFGLNLYMHWGDRFHVPEWAGLTLVLSVAGFGLTLVAGVVDTARPKSRPPDAAQPKPLDRKRSRPARPVGLGHGPSPV